MSMLCLDSVVGRNRSGPYSFAYRGGSERRGAFCRIEHYAGRCGKTHATFDIMRRFKRDEMEFSGADPQLVNNLQVSEAGVKTTQKK